MLNNVCNAKILIVASTALYQTSDKTSFASISARDRWPVILVRIYWVCSASFFGGLVQFGLLLSVLLVRGRPPG
jgi:hypothetical protein